MWIDHAAADMFSTGRAPPQARDWADSSVAGRIGTILRSMFTI